MNGGLWRRVEASITLGNNAMTNQRGSGMTIALERIQYWEIELIDGRHTGDTRLAKQSIREPSSKALNLNCAKMPLRSMRFLIDHESIILLSLSNNQI